MCAGPQPERIAMTGKDLATLMNVPECVVNRQPLDVMTGKELASLMRRHGVTIKELAKRIQIPQNRVRMRRDTGFFREPELVRDWIQAITGTDPGPQGMKGFSP